MSEKASKPPRKARMVLPRKAGDWFTLQSRWEGVAYTDEQRFTTLKPAMEAFWAAIGRKPEHEWRVRQLRTVIEWRQGRAVHDVAASIDELTKLVDATGSHH